MKLIAQHPYIKVERKVNGHEQFVIEHQRMICLYEDKVVTQYREFPIQLVTDFAYRAIAEQGGLLYLYTLQGVFTYQVTTSPEAFIKAYKAYFK